MSCQGSGRLFFKKADRADKKVSLQGRSYTLTVDDIGHNEESVVSCKQSIGTCYCIGGCKSSSGLYYKCFTVSFTPATKELMTKKNASGHYLLNICRTSRSTAVVVFRNIAVRLGAGLPRLKMSQRKSPKRDVMPGIWQAVLQKS